MVGCCPIRPPSGLLAHRRTIGARIREARHAAGLTQMQVGEVTGLDHKTIHRIEYATTGPSLSMLIPIAHAVRAPLSDLVRP